MLVWCEQIRRHASAATAASTLDVAYEQAVKVLQQQRERKLALAKELEEQLKAVEDNGRQHWLWQQ